MQPLGGVGPVQFVPAGSVAADLARRPEARCVVASHRVRHAPHRRRSRQDAPGPWASGVVQAKVGRGCTSGTSPTQATRCRGTTQRLIALLWNSAEFAFVARVMRCNPEGMQRSAAPGRFLFRDSDQRGATCMCTGQTPPSHTSQLAQARQRPARQPHGSNNKHNSTCFDAYSVPLTPRRSHLHRSSPLVLSVGRHVGERDGGVPHRMWPATTAHWRRGSGEDRGVRQHTERRVLKHSGFSDVVLDESQDRCLQGEGLYLCVVMLVLCDGVSARRLVVVKKAIPVSLGPNVGPKM